MNDSPQDPGMIIIPQPQIIQTETIPQNPEFNGLRMIDYQRSNLEQERIRQGHYQFQYEGEIYSQIFVTLCRKGAVGRYRVVAIANPNLQSLIDLVKYDPANPPANNYEALEMMKAHRQTQMDFVGEKKKNASKFQQYIQEGLEQVHTLYLPMITGWQPKKVFDKTIFLIYDGTNPNAMYGKLYLPKVPIMQADGQTQTAALFQVAYSEAARSYNPLDTLFVTLEIELGVNEQEAAKSFADRNGRGTRKDVNLVIELNEDSPLNDLRNQAIKGTIFERRIGKTQKSANIVDLSTMQQMLLNVISGGYRKPEEIKRQHVRAFLPYCRDFILMLQELFRDAWPEVTRSRSDHFRVLYVHAWPYCLKALALAYHHIRIEELGPIASSIGSDEPKRRDKSMNGKPSQKISKPTLTLDQFRERLMQIDWLRYRRHWADISGVKEREGVKKTLQLKSTGEVVVDTFTPNTPADIAKVKDKILSDSWQDLCSHKNEPI